MLTARSDQLRRAAALIHDARGGVAGVLGVVGEAGTGKTALLDAVVDAVVSDHGDVVVLRAAGVAEERALGYGVLGALLRPVLATVDGLEARPRRALRSAIGLDDAPSDPLAVGTAVVELVSAASEASTVVVVVDDVQWVDADTRRAVGFLLRRIGGQRVAVLLAARTAAELPDDVDEPMHLTDLTVAQSRELLGRRAADLDEAVAAVLARRCGGNALVLVEVLAGLTADQRQGWSPLGELAPLPDRVARAFYERIDRLGPEAKDALLVTIGEGRGLARIVHGLCGGDAVQSLLDVGLVTCEGPVLRIRHPLLAAAMLERATPQERRAVHARLAAAVHEDEPERAVWHRAWSAVGPDPAVAVALADAGRRQRLQGAPLAAAGALERAAELSGDPRAQSDLYVEAALMALDGGDAASARALVTHAAATGEASPGQSLVLGRLSRLHGRHVEAVEHFAGAARVAPPAWLSAIRFEQLWAALDSKDHALVVEAAAAVEADADVQPPMVAVLRALVGHDVTWAEGSTEGLPALIDVVAVPLAPDAPVELVRLVAHAANRCGAHTLSESLHLRASRLHSDAGDVLGAADSLAWAGFLAFLQGRWVAARARYSQARLLVDEELAPELMSSVIQVESEIAAIQGREDDCRILCRQLEQLGQICEDSYGSVLADHRQALLEMGLQRWDRALPLLERATQTLARSGRWHPYFSPALDLVEVLLRLQHPDRAAAAAEVFLSRTAPGSPPMGHARAARMRALLAPVGQADALFEESARLDAAVGLAFPLSRTWLCHAERLRREHRTVQAAELLTRALATFDRLEALPWSDRAKSELAACGRPQTAPSAVPLHALLTAQELQIAVMVSEGLRNRAIGAALFLSLRTVEFHLSSVYRKLGVSGRTQLVSQMTARG